MLVSRLLTQAAAFSAAILFIGFSFAQAAVPGGANVVVEGWVVTTVEEAPDPQAGTSGLFFIAVTGTFFVESLIENPDAL